MKSVIIYSSALNAIGGIETFILNFCKRLSPFYKITFVYDNAEIEMLVKISDYVDCLSLEKQQLECDTLILATAWGKNPEQQIKCERQIQMIHAQYDYYIENWKFKYIKGKNTTHHVAVGRTVAEAFERATPYKCDKVIYNLL